MRTLILIVMTLSLTGCAALAAGLASVGAGFGVGHYVNGTNYRTFTEPLPKVRIATLNAFQRMAIKVDAMEKTKAGEVLTATAKDRRIEVELEAITPNATRMRSVAKHEGSILLDQATGLEIVVQTEKVLNRWATSEDHPETSSPLRPSSRVLPSTDAQQELATTSQTRSLK
jgi:hypothetical protein